VFLFSVGLLPQVGYADSTEFFEIGLEADVALQAEIYSGAGDPLPNSWGHTQNGITVRHAMIGATGSIGEHVQFEIEAGTATCLRGGGFMLMDATVLYSLAPELKVGLKKGHILRGFELHDECMEVLTAEKPVFAKCFSPCHPTGAVLETRFDLGGSAAIEGELAYLNDETNATTENQYDINIGLILRTPVEGLSIGGYYNPIRTTFGYELDSLGQTKFDENWNPIPIHDDGFRAGFGADYQAHGLTARGEYYLGQGFFRGTAGSYAPRPADHQMRGFYIQGGYRIRTGLNALPHIQPYCRYQFWDKESNAPSETKDYIEARVKVADWDYQYLTTGVALELGSEKAILRVDYETPISTPDGIMEEVDGQIQQAEVADEAGRLLIRMQTRLWL